MGNFAKTKFTPGDHVERTSNSYVREVSQLNGKCCICGAPIKRKLIKDDGVCPDPDCTRETFFTEAFGMLNLESNKIDRSKEKGVYEYKGKWTVLVRNNTGQRQRFGSFTTKELAEKRHAEVITQLDKTA